MVIYEGTGKNEVALCFDDGPNPKVTPKILEILKEKGVKATFFLIGRRAEENSDIVKLIVEHGHDIGNHSYSHASGGIPKIQREKGEQAIIDEISKTSDVIKKIVNITPKFYRPQGMDWKEEYGELAKPFFEDNIIMSNVGSSDYNWNHDTHEWDENDLYSINKKSKEIIEDVESRVVSGSIITLHDSAEYCLPGNDNHTTWMNRALPTLKALPVIIDNLDRKGLVIKKLSEMDLKKEPIKSNIS